MGAVTDDLYTDAKDETLLADIWNKRFLDAMSAKQEYTDRWGDYFRAYHGDYFKNESLPDYRSDLVSNYVYSTIETIKPIMLESNPKFSVMARQPEGLAYADDLQEALSYEWDREGVGTNLIKHSTNALVIGNAVSFLSWDDKAKEVKCTFVNPFNIFPDPLATCVDDAEYIIYASYKNINKLKTEFPKKSDKLNPGRINYSTLVNENDANASHIDNQVLVLEVWSKEMEVYKHFASGSVKLIYPHGRRIILAPELGVILSDTENPYDDGKLPFSVWKDCDIPGKFWGEGEVAQLLSPQKHMNDLNNAILDNAKATANMPWIIDKNAGVPQNSITARPGLIIRKNPGTDVRREQPPSMPVFVTNAVEIYKNDMESVSGIFDTLKGNRATGVYTAQGILALQEAGTSRIRLKVKLLEGFLGDLGNKWCSRMRQFWDDRRWIGIVRYDGQYDIKAFNSTSLEYDYTISISAGSTMAINRGAMLDLMIRLAQTQMPDGQPLVDREAVVAFLPQEVKTALLKRMSGENQSIQALEQGLQELASQFEQFVQQDQQQDQEVVAAIEDIGKAVEQIGAALQQMQQKYDAEIQKRDEDDKLNQLKSESYNSGYSDAESMFSAQASPDEASPPQSLDQLPDDLLKGLGELSKDELAILVQQNPELVELINSQGI
jgi:hypothetical protein